VKADGLPHSVIPPEMPDGRYRTPNAPAAARSSRSVAGTPAGLRRQPKLRSHVWVAGRPAPARSKLAASRQRTASTAVTNSVARPLGTATAAEPAATKSINANNRIGVVMLT